MFASTYLRTCLSQIAWRTIAEETILATILVGSTFYATANLINVRAKMIGQAKG